MLLLVLPPPPCSASNQLIYYPVGREHVAGSMQGEASQGKSSWLWGDGGQSPPVCAPGGS